MKSKELIERMKKEFPQYAEYFLEHREHGDRITFIAFIGHYKPEFEPIAQRCLAAVRSIVGSDIHSYIYYDRWTSVLTGVSVILEDFYNLTGTKTN